MTTRSWGWDKGPCALDLKEPCRCGLSLILRINEGESEDVHALRTGLHVVTLGQRRLELARWWQLKAWELRPKKCTAMSQEQSDRFCQYNDANSPSSRYLSCLYKPARWQTCFTFTTAIAQPSKLVGFKLYVSFWDKLDTIRGMRKKAQLNAWNQTAKPLYSVNAGSTWALYTLNDGRQDPWPMPALDLTPTAAYFKRRWVCRFVNMHLAPKFPWPTSAWK